MIVRLSMVSVLIVGSLSLVGCATTIYNLKIPLDEASATAPLKADGRVVIEDRRPEMERKAHLGKEIKSCERWFGDDTIVPSKLAFLAARVSDRTRSDMQIHILLKRFDIIEYCEFTSGGNGTSAATFGFTPAPNTGDTVVVHLTGEVNGMPFDLESRFDYGKMYYRFPNLPSSSLQYRGQLRDRLEQFVKEIANIVWTAEIARISKARN